ncbi:hypothetical protein [Dehalococcoides mccartyi]|uniref:Uncharacterized protein n=1 Tax=Dehalococcoides mccartyi (strain ATCC BAA-2266 / KCTC 15142 / 195) TaxID=243164 RepID=Q3Z9R1_DEHM1|nr:hypothetical protein [Dehalococcoides mccartyi]AAW39851.1 hypothetical protein DET0900 [Dehalococcoides mccartyi 195]AAW40394.1 hypothetical protein DET0290 [Dehalococcoides mccartyi 195]AAW40441.1 hypothetical protein DET0267 [Dehalococcoides mccartyi 195]
MQKIFGVVIGIIGIAVVFIIFPMVMDSTHDVQTDRYVETEAAVATGAGETSAGVVLTYELYNNVNTSVISITSDEVTDVPVAGTWTQATKTLTVTGLAAEDSRTLTITYEHDALTGFTGMGAFAGIIPLLILVAIISVLVAGIWSSVKGRG